MPFTAEHDALRETVRDFVSRELRRPVRMDLTHLDPEIPPAARMAGLDLVTEGTLTLARAATLLEQPAPAETSGNAAHSLVALMLESDIVEFLVGTRINEAHKDPNVPVELDLRRNIVRSTGDLLESRHLKQVTIRFV